MNDRKKIALIIAHKDYQAVEYGVPKKMFQEAGYAVITVSDKSGKAEAEDGASIKVDVVLSEFDPITCDGICFRICA